jgi:preprotein translocase subunit YajC
MSLIPAVMAVITPILAQGGGCARGGEGEGNMLYSFLPIILIFVIFYFLLIRPQQKRQREHQTMLDRISKGDRVITSGGLYGTVVGVKDNIVVLRVADDVKMEFAKSSVTAIVTKG